jgi:hypothetical protein
MIDEITGETSDCSEHFHPCLACGKQIEGVSCDSPSEDKYCPLCKELPHFQRTVLHHLNAIATFTCTAGMDIAELLQVFDFGDGDESDSATETKPS